MKRFAYDHVLAWMQGSRASLGTIRLKTFETTTVRGHSAALRCQGFGIQPTGSSVFILSEETHGASHWLLPFISFGRSQVTAISGSLAEPLRCAAFFFDHSHSYPEHVSSEFASFDMTDSGRTTAGTTSICHHESPGRPCDSERRRSIDTVNA